MVWFVWNILFYFDKIQFNCIKIWTKLVKTVLETTTVDLVGVNRVTEDHNTQKQATIITIVRAFLRKSFNLYQVDGLIPVGSMFNAIQNLQTSSQIQIEWIMLGSQVFDNKQTWRNIERVWTDHCTSPHQIWLTLNTNQHLQQLTWDFTILKRKSSHLNYSLYIFTH